MELKECNKCLVVKPLLEFGKHSQIKSGRHPTCKQCRSGSERERYEAIRIQAINILGGRCVVCDFSDIRALQIDHVNGGGCKHRQEESYNSILKRIINGDTDDFQILCANHNWIKRAENDENRGHEYRRI